MTVDSLIKGDVDTMTETIDRDVQTMKCLSYVMTVFILLMVAALIWLSVQLSVWDWSLEQTVPTAVLALVLWGVAMFAGVWADRIKRDHDLITYQEILSFWHGEPVDRDTERGRRERLIPRWMRVIRTIGMALIAAAIGAFVGYWGASLAEMLFG